MFSYVLEDTHILMKIYFSIKLYFQFYFNDFISANSCMHRRLLLYAPSSPPRPLAHHGSCDGCAPRTCVGRSKYPSTLKHGIQKYASELYTCIFYTIIPVIFIVIRPRYASRRMIKYIAVHTKWYSFAISSMC